MNNKCDAKKKNKSEVASKKINFNSLINYKKKTIEEFPCMASINKKKCSIGSINNLKDEDLIQMKDPPSTLWEKQISCNRLPFSFYNVACQELAQNMLGKILVRNLDNGIILKGRIVETESYLGMIDKASHTYQGKVTPRNIPMYMLPGTTYIYFTYGMYHCMNISSQEKGSAVLIRALEPLEGVEKMHELRNTKRNTTKEIKEHDLCNGPSKLCIAMNLERGHSRYSLCDWKGLWLEDDEKYKNINIIETSRIGIESVGEEWAKKKLRYYIYDHKCVSKRDKNAETLFCTN